MKAADLLSAVTPVPSLDHTLDQALDKVGRSLSSGRATVLRSGVAAGAALVALSAASAAASAIRRRTES